MTAREKLRSRALAAIPDTPATVETRALALDPASYIHAIGDGWLVLAGAGDLACVYGTVDMAAIEAILGVAGFDGDLLVPANGRAKPALPAGWSAERASIFTAGTQPLPPDPASPFREAFAVRRLARGDALAHLPSTLRAEIDAVRAARSVYAAFSDGTPVSFAYVSRETERHGDLSIDTLEAFRRRGAAEAASRPVIAELHLRDKRPVWGAIDSNAASLALARRLGFTQRAGLLWVATRTA